MPGRSWNIIENTDQSLKQVTMYKEIIKNKKKKTKSKWMLSLPVCLKNKLYRSNTEGKEYYKIPKIYYDDKYIY